MRKINRTTAFNRDYKRVISGKYKNIEKLLTEAIHLLLQDSPLPARFRDHSLTGNLYLFRECHIKPDLLLIYLKTPDELKLIRLGSHSDLFK